MRTPQFIQLVESTTASRNTPDTVRERIFFGYSEPYEHHDGSRRWQGALVRVGLGAASLGGFRYHFFLAETDKYSGAFINTVETAIEPTLSGESYTIPGLCDGDGAVIYPGGRIDVIIQGRVLLPGEPEINE